MADAAEPGLDADHGVSVRFYRPSDWLRTAVSTFYVLRMEVEAPVEDLLHPEWPNLRLLQAGQWTLTFEGKRSVTTAAPAALISGTLSKAALARCGPGVLVGVGLLPAGWAQLTDRSAADHTDQIGPLAALVGEAAADELLCGLAGVTRDEDYCAVLDAWFLKVMTPAAQSSALLVDAHRALVDPELASVADWARRLGRSTRQLERISLDYFGMSPKRLLRRQRFLRTFAAIRDQPLGAWGRLLDERYADQPQFIREFRYFIGLSPRDYFSRPWPFMIAAGDARKALLGAPVQGLHRPED